MPADGERREDDWTDLTTVHDAGEARQVLDLLERARVPARLAGAGAAPGANPFTDPGAWTIEVPSAELPVAAGVIDHFLAELRHRPEGDARPAEILAALGGTGDPELADALACERGRAARRAQAYRAVVLGVIGLLLVAIAAGVLQAFR